MIKGYTAHGNPELRYTRPENHADLDLAATKLFPETANQTKQTIQLLHLNFGFSKHHGLLKP
jgi:hypothetical protein